MENPSFSFFFSGFVFLRKIIKTKIHLYKLKQEFSADFGGTIPGYNLVVLTKLHIHKPNLTQPKLF